MNTTIIISISLAFLLILIFLKLNKKEHKSLLTKKSEIREEYFNQLRDILKKYNDNPEEQLEQKKNFIKKCNDELSRNIFFSDVESNKIVSDLAKL